MSKRNTTAKAAQSTSMKQQVSKILLGQLIADAEGIASCKYDPIDRRIATLKRSISYNLINSGYHKNHSLASWSSEHFEMSFEYGKLGGTRISYMNNQGLQSAVFQASEWNCMMDYLKRRIDRLIDRLHNEKEEEARKDWITAKDTNTILGYKAFITNHPRCKYREEADVLIANMKGKLLNEMRQYPFRFNRENMYQYISTNVLTMEDLVDNSNILTDRGYSHIKQYPTLHSEQRDLPISKLENPTSEEGNTDIYFFGVSGRCG